MPLPGWGTAIGFATKWLDPFLSAKQRKLRERANLKKEKKDIEKSFTKDPVRLARLAAIDDRLVELQAELESLNS